MESSPRAPWRDRLYVVIFEADTPAGLVFDIALLVAIVISVTAVCLETVDSIAREYGDWLWCIEWLCTGLFTIEYGFRLLCTRRPWRYALSFYGIVDLLSVLPAYVGLAVVGLTVGGGSPFAVVRSFRLIRVFRILKLIHLSGESEALASAFWRARAKIVVFLAMVFITVTIAGTAMYEVERINSPQDTEFTSIPQAIYWAIVTMTTVGYGDIVPTTTLGQLLSAVLILVGYSLIIVPTGFVSVEIMESRRSGSTKTCAWCLLEGHAPDAVHCRRCGQVLGSKAEATEPYRTSIDDGDVGLATSN